MSRIVESLSMEEAFKHLNKLDSDDLISIVEAGKSKDLKRKFFTWLQVNGGKLSAKDAQGVTHRIYISVYHESADSIFGAYGALATFTDFEKYVGKEILNQLYSDTTNYVKACENLIHIFQIYEDKSQDNRTVLSIYADGEDGSELLVGDDTARKSITKILKANSDKWKDSGELAIEIKYIEDPRYYSFICVDYVIPESESISNLTNLQLFEAAAPYIISISANSKGIYYKYFNK